MPTHRPKRPRDTNQLAKAIVDIATGVDSPPETAEQTEKDAAAVELGRRGGLKGGRARAKTLTAKQLSDIGKNGAVARWGKERSG